MDVFKPTFRITPAIMKDVAHLEAAREVIANASLIPAWERQFKQEAMVRQVYHSTHIEGNPLSFSQAQQVVEQGSLPAPARDRDIQEIINYRNVVNYISQQPAIELNAQTLCCMHQLVTDKILPGNQSGAFRQVQVNIVNNHSQQAVFTPPSAKQVPSLVNGFFDWLSSSEGSELPAVLQAGIGHYELVRIHPFVDGNGRTTRVMAMLILYQGGFNKQFFCLDEYYDLDAAAYYAALQQTNETGDLTYWLEYFLHGLAVEFSQVKERVIELSRDHALRKKLGQIALNDRQIKLLKVMEESGQISRADWTTIFPGISDDTILRDLTHLMDKKLVKKKGKTKASVYMLR